MTNPAPEDVTSDEWPRLNYNQKSFIIAKDSKRNRVKLGGLGALGVGEMWLTADDNRRKDPAWATAPEEQSFILHEDVQNDKIKFGNVELDESEFDEAVFICSDFLEYKGEKYFRLTPARKAAEEMLEALKKAKGALVSEYDYEKYLVNFPYIEAAIAKATAVESAGEET